MESHDEIVQDDSDLVECPRCHELVHVLTSDRGVCLICYAAMIGENKANTIFNGTKE